MADLKCTIGPPTRKEKNNSQFPAFFSTTGEFTIKESVPAYNIGVLGKQERSAHASSHAYVMRFPKNDKQHLILVSHV